MQFHYRVNSAPNQPTMKNDLNGVQADDPFLLRYQPAELRIASEFLTTWLPFLCKDLCHNCNQNLSNRIRSLDSVLDGGGGESESFNLDESRASLSSNNNVESLDMNDCDNCDTNSLGSWKDAAENNNSLPRWKDGVNGWSENDVGVASTSGGGDSNFELSLVGTSSQRMSWADMAQEDELEEEEEEQHDLNRQMSDLGNSSGESKVSKALEKPQLSVEVREYMRFMNVKREKDFICFEKIKGKIVNILKGLELHKGVFSAAEQKRIVNYVYALQERGKKGELKERTYTAPQKWMKGKGRVTIQFGCCYNYAMDKHGNPPGILQNDTVDPIPRLFKVMIRRLVKWHVLPSSCVPDSCIVNIYEQGDCIPPHIDNHDFLRPFCTVSFLSQCNILFGSNLKAVAAGDFAGSIGIPLPVGSVLVLNGNAADVAKHCVPAVPTERISITFRKMDESKRPIGFVPEPDLHGIETLSYNIDKTKLLPHMKRQPFRREGQTEAREPPQRNDTRSEPRYSSRDDIRAEPHYSSRSRRVPTNRRRIMVNPDI